MLVFHATSRLTMSPSPTSTANALSCSFQRLIQDSRLTASGPVHVYQDQYTRPRRIKPSMSIASGRDAAVHVPDGAGDPAGGGRQQERDRVGQVANGAGAAQWVKGVKAVQCRLQLVLGHELLVDRGGHPGRGDCIDANLVWCQFQRQVASHSVQAAFGE